MRIIAWFLRKVEISRKHCSSLHFNTIATSSTVNRSLQVVSRMNLNDLPRAGRIRQRTLYVNARQFSGPVKLPDLRERRGVET